MQPLALSTEEAALILEALNSHEGVVSTDYLKAVREDSEALRRMLATELARIRTLADRIRAHA